MSRTYSSRARDTAIANESSEDRTMKCRAAGCPNDGCIDIGNGRLCGPHCWSEPRDWPAVTQRQLEREVERAQALAERDAMPPPTAEEIDEAKRKLLEFARTGLGSTTGNDWAHRLRDRELNHGGILRNGQRMTQAQREMWRAALGDRARSFADTDPDLGESELTARKRDADERVRRHLAASDAGGFRSNDR